MLDFTVHAVSVTQHVQNVHHNVGATIKGSTIILLHQWHLKLELDYQAGTVKIILITRRP